jgi:hypothetical protein
VVADAKPSYVVLTPDRYVDTNPITAAAVIGATTTAIWAKAVAAGSVAGTISPVDHGHLVAPSSANLGGSALLLARAQTIEAFVAQFSTALRPTETAAVPPAAAALLAGLPGSVQLCETAGWSTSPAAATSFDTTLAAQTTSLGGRIVIAPPAGGTYSLASESAPILITVVNNLPVAVRVQIRMSSVGGVAGFRIDDAGVQSIPPNSRHTIKVQAHVARSGHFKASAQLLTPDGAPLGSALPLSIYSSAFGTIGVVITVVALAVLVLALINRGIKRWRQHRALVRLVAAQPRQRAGVPG